MGAYGKEGSVIMSREGGCWVLGSVFKCTSLNIPLFIYIYILYLNFLNHYFIKSNL